MKKSRFGKAFIDELNEQVLFFENKVSYKSNHFHKHPKGDQLWQEMLMSGSIDEPSTPFLSSWCKVSLIIVVMVFFAALFFRLFHLQVVEGSHNRDLADFNRIQVKVIHAPRGVIYDRNGKILANNEPGFRLVEDIKTSKYKHLSRDEALELEAKSDPKALNLEIDSNRAYPWGEKLSHILGYVGEISKDELKNAKFKDYKGGDKIGRSGVEQSYEKVLRGIDGGEIIEVDAQGKKVRTLRRKEAVPGQSLYLTVDVDLQITAFENLSEAIKKNGIYCGAVIAQQPQTGEILSLVSIPSFDPTNISFSLTQPNSPLLNRAIGGVYPPGSTFKIVSGLSGLSSGKITPKQTFEDTGVMNLGPFKFTNWYFTQYGKTEGSVDLVKALKRSNDIYFYNIGQLVGDKVLAETAKTLGLGQKLGIDIPGEETGLIPNNEWKVKNIGDVWYPGDSLHMAIGQGFVLTTPLQISYLVSTIASSGAQYPPHLALKITDPNGHEIKKFEYESVSKEKYSKEQLDVIKKGLEEVTLAGGTAWPFFTFPIKTAGKTGTAEFGDPKERTHAWYTSYAPVDDPRIALTVLVEAGGEGSSVSGPIAKEIYRWYFSEDKKNLIKDIGPIIATDSARTLGE